MFLLAAIPFCAAAVLAAVGEAAEDRGGAFPIALEVASLGLVVTAASVRAPLLAVACLVPLALHTGAPLAARLRRPAPTRGERREPERARAAA